jgi:putative ABC transport system permease protein
MLGFLAKGLFRDRSRSLFPLLTVAIGVSLVVLLDNYLRGVTDGMFNTTASFVCGHLRVATRAYDKAGTDASNELALLGVDSLEGVLRRDFPGITWTPRTTFGGLLDVPDSTGNTRVQAPAAGIAVDLSKSSPELRILRLERSIASGRLPAEPGEILLSDDFARRLGVGPGDRVTLISSTMNGSMATWNFTLSGTVRFGITAMDRAAMIANISDVQQALDMPDAATEILGFMPGAGYDDKQAARLATRFNTGLSGGTRKTGNQPDAGPLDHSTTGARSVDDYAPEMETLRIASGLGSMFDIVGAATALVVSIFVTAMAVVLWNAGLMGSLRRYGEIGVRLAMGESKGRVYRSLIAEAFLVGLVGSAIGTAIGLGVSLYLQEVGFNISGMLPNATMVIDDVIRARIAPSSVLVGFVPGLLSTFFGAAISGLGVYRRQTAMLAKELGS